VRPLVCVSRGRTVITAFAGRASRRFAGSIATWRLAKAGKKSATGWSSASLPSSISSAAAVPVIGLVIE